MKKSLKTVVRGIIILIAFNLPSGCSQHDDVLIPQDRATISLDPRYLPELDSMFVYELWMVDASGEDVDFTFAEARYKSLARFTWDYSVGRFRDITGNIIDKEFAVPGFWFDHDYIVVTVEYRYDPDPQHPSGVFMLVDEVIDPTTRPIVLKFPCDLFAATGFYFVASPTDDTSYYDFEGDSVVRYSVNEGKGLWLCSRAFTEQPGNVQDTLGIMPDSDGNDSVYYEVSPEPGTGDIIYEPDLIGIVHPPGGWPSVVEIDTVILGYDSIFDHRRVEFVFIDTIDTNNNYTLWVEYDTLPGRTYGYYTYMNSLESLPDIGLYGWRYNGWVILEEPAPGGEDDNSGMNLASVIPFGNGKLQRFTGLNSWGVLPLGAFDDPNRPDFENTYIDNREVPQYPGEDFVKDAPSRFDNLNLRRITDHSWGFIVVGMEPDPAHLVMPGPTNFPLFILSAELPDGNLPAYLNDNPDDDVQVLHNWTQFLPRIEITVINRE